MYHKEKQKNKVTANLIHAVVDAPGGPTGPVTNI